MRFDMLADNNRLPHPALLLPWSAATDPGALEAGAHPD